MFCLRLLIALSFSSVFFAKFINFLTWHIHTLQMFVAYIRHVFFHRYAVVSKTGVVLVIRDLEFSGVGERSQ